MKSAFLSYIVVSHRKLVLAGMLSGVAAMSAHAQERIRVESATYGGNVNLQAVGGNATDDIARFCDHRSVCDYEVTIGRLGDPFPNVPKDFAVRYNCDGRAPRRAALPPEADRKIIRLICP